MLYVFITVGQCVEWKYLWLDPDAKRGEYSIVPAGDRGGTGTVTSSGSRPLCTLLHGARRDRSRNVDTP